MYLIRDLNRRDKYVNRMKLTILWEILDL